MPRPVDPDQPEPFSLDDEAPASGDKRVWFAIGIVVFGAMLGLVLAVVIATWRREGNELQAEAPPAPKTEPKKDGKPIVPPKPDDKQPQPPLPKVDESIDRKAAEYILSVGGVVNVSGRYPEVKTLADLPKTPFTLSRVTLDGNTKVTDAGLACLRGCAGLHHLSLNDTTIGDAGLAHVKDCKALGSLSLAHIRITDAGLLHLKDLPKLSRIDLGHTQITDAGLAHFGNYPNLTYVSVYATPISDAGLAHLHNCPKLNSIDTRGSRITPAGIAALRKALPKCNILAD